MEEESNPRLEALREQLERLREFKTVLSESTPLVEDRQATEKQKRFLLKAGMRTLKESRRRQKPGRL